MSQDLREKKSKNQQGVQRELLHIEHVYRKLFSVLPLIKKQLKKKLVVCLSKLSQLDILTIMYG